MGVRGIIAALMVSLLTAVLVSITGLFLMFLLRRILRLQWLAAATFVAIVVMNSASTWGTVTDSAAADCERVERVSDRPLDHALWLSGLCVGRGAGSGRRKLPVAGRLSAWYAGSGLFALAFCLILLAWATRTALAGQPLFGTSSEQ